MLLNLIVMIWPKWTGDCYLPEKQLEEIQILPFHLNTCSSFTNVVSGVKDVTDSLQGCMVTTKEFVSPQLLFTVAIPRQEMDTICSNGCYSLQV